jgi:hypothetical protein
MSSSDLRSSLESLASSFADAVLEAIRTASLDELVSGGERTASRTRRPRDWARALPEVRGGRSGRKNGRSRRSPTQIAGALEQVVALVKKHKDGLRSEEIRAELGMQATEMPRVLTEGLSTKVLRSKGQRRGTRYFAR